MDRVDLILSLPPDPLAPGVVRRTFTGFAPFLTPQTLDDTRLLATEIVTNAVRHAGLEPSDRVEVRATVSSGRVRVDVTAGNRPFEPPGSPGAGSDGGWGLFLVSALSNRWGIHRAKEGVSVWFEIQGDRRPADATAPTEDTGSDGWAGIGLRRRPRATDSGGWP